MTKTIRPPSTLSAFLHYVSLNMLAMLGTSCYILADTFFVANGIGEDGLTALTDVSLKYSNRITLILIPSISIISGRFAEIKPDCSLSVVCRA